MFKRKKELIQKEYLLWLERMPKEILEEKAMAYDAMVAVQDKGATLYKSEYQKKNGEKELAFCVCKEDFSMEPDFLFYVLLRGGKIQQYKVASSNAYCTIQERAIEFLGDDVTVFTFRNLYGRMSDYMFTSLSPVYQKTNRYKGNQLVSSEEKKETVLVRQTLVEQDSILVKQKIDGAMVVQGNYMTNTQFDQKYEQALKRTWPNNKNS